MTVKQGLVGTGAVVVLVASGFLILGRGGAAVAIPDVMDLVCVKTGKTFHIKRNQINMIPAKNPDTGTRTLLPYEKRDTGLFIKERYTGALTGDLLSENQYVDIETFAIKTSN